MENGLWADLLKDLCAVPGVSGHEDAISAELGRRGRPYADECYSDVVGNRFFVKKGCQPDFTVMLCAHMDEIGFMVCDITPNGFLYLVPIGYHDPRLLINQTVTIHTQEKGEVTGVIGMAKPIHLLGVDELQKPFTMQDIRVDVGAMSQNEAEALGIAPGDIVTFQRNGHVMNDKYFAAKAIDNRAGCAVMLEVLRRLQGETIEPNLVAVGAVQEEIGFRGSIPASAAVKPDIGLAIDVTFAADDSQARFPQSTAILFGKGPAIQMVDWSPNHMSGNIVNPKLWRRLLAVAKENGIPAQYEVMMNGGTDAIAMHASGTGAVSGCISLPQRYMHSTVGYVCMEDLEASTQLILAFLRSLKEKFPCNP